MVMLMAVRNLARGNAAMRIPVAGTFRYASLRHASTGTYNTTKIDGLRVASCDDGGRTSAVALVARAGSRFEPIPGASFLLEKFAFKVHITPHPSEMIQSSFQISVHIS